MTGSPGMEPPSNNAVIRGSSTTEFSPVLLARAAASVRAGRSIGGGSEYRKLDVILHVRRCGRSLWHHEFLVGRRRQESGQSKKYRKRYHLSFVALPDA